MMAYETSLVNVHLHEVVSGERDQLMKHITESLNTTVRRISGCGSG